MSFLKPKPLSFPLIIIAIGPLSIGNRVVNTWSNFTNTILNRLTNLAVPTFATDVIPASSLQLLNYNRQGYILAPGDTVTHDFSFATKNMIASGGMIVVTFPVVVSGGCLVTYGLDDISPSNTVTCTAVAGASSTAMTIQNFKLVTPGAMVTLHFRAVVPAVAANVKIVTYMDQLSAQPIDTLTSAFTLSISSSLTIPNVYTVTPASTTAGLSSAWTLGFQHNAAGSLTGEFSLPLTDCLTVLKSWSSRLHLTLPLPWRLRSPAPSRQTEALQRP